MTAVELCPYGDDDLWLSQALERDPVVMRELGGPRPDAEIEAAHRGRVAGAVEGTWWLKVLFDGEAAGAIGIWASEWRGQPIDEIGWMLLPPFQGRGVASAALGMLLAQAGAEPRLARLHAFPGIANGASNALCRKFDFELLEECSVEFSGRPLRCNHWRLDLGRAR